MPVVLAMTEGAVAVLNGGFWESRGASVSAKSPQWEAAVPMQAVVRFWRLWDCPRPGLARTCQAVPCAVPVLEPCSAVALQGLAAAPGHC